MTELHAKPCQRLLYGLISGQSQKWKWGNLDFHSGFTNTDRVSQQTIPLNTHTELASHGRRRRRREARNLTGKVRAQIMPESLEVLSHSGYQPLVFNKCVCVCVRVHPCITVSLTSINLLIFVANFQSQRKRHFRSDCFMLYKSKTQI